MAAKHCAQCEFIGFVQVRLLLISDKYGCGYDNGPHMGVPQAAKVLALSYLATNSGAASILCKLLLCGLPAAAAAAAAESITWLRPVPVDV